MSATEKLEKPAPHKLLALAGGGIRGVISIEILARIEEELRRDLGAGDDFVLADYFDYIAGNSTGAIIATLLSLGFSASQVRDFYAESGEEMFEKANLFQKLFYRYRANNLRRRIKEVVGAETRLGSEDLRTLLLLVAQNVTTRSPWLVTNNPYARFNQRSEPGCNLDLPLWQLVRASTAAPVFFPPEEAVVGSEKFVFVDGGLTPFNDPAFQLFVMATSPAYSPTLPAEMRWPSGEDKLLLVSVGTGTLPLNDTELSPDEMWLFYSAREAPASLMSSAAWQQDLLCRMFGRCVHGEPLDLEVGDLRGAGIHGVDKLFTYVRYEPEISRWGLNQLGLDDIAVRDVSAMDDVAHMGEMRKVGEAYAQRVKAEHFAGFR